MSKMILMATAAGEHIAIQADKLLNQNQLVSVVDATATKPCLVWKGDDMFYNGRFEAVGLPGQVGHAVYEQIKKILLDDKSPGSLYVETNPAKGSRVVWNAMKLLQGTEQIVGNNPNNPSSRAYVRWHDKYHSFKKIIDLGDGDAGNDAAIQLTTMLNSGRVLAY